MTYTEALASTSKVVLTSDGTTAMDTEIKNAIKNYSVIIFDGSNNTDFWLNQYIAFDGLKDKTLIGVNGARLCTKFYLTSDIHQMLNNYKWTTTTGVQKTGVKAGSTSSNSNKFGALPNGQSVGEESEYLTRKALIEHLNDNSENFRKAGVFQFKNCENFIIRNLKFVGPGPCDVGGYDLMSMTGSKHFWVDHCEFTDGMDGNFDITNNSDFSTISWCTFSYTGRAYAHMNTNLVGSSDSDGMLNNNGAGYYLNLTFAYNHWGSGCDQRMPMARAGKIHMLNNYYTCTNNSSSINPRKNSEFYIEGNYFADGVKTVFSQTDAKAYQWISSGDHANVIASSGVSIPSSSGTVSIPYSYKTDLTAADVPTEVGTWAGATLFRAEATAVVVSPANKTIEIGSALQLSAQVLPAGADQSVTWSSSDDTKAEVSASGKVTAKAAGTVKIMAEAVNGVKDYCVLTVVEKQGEDGVATFLPTDFSSKTGSATKEGVTLTLKVEGYNDSSHGNTMKCKSDGNTLTFSSGNDITSIVVNCNSSYSSNITKIKATSNVGSVTKDASNYKYTWTGNTKNVTITFGLESGQTSEQSVYVSSIDVVTVSSPSTPTTKTITKYISSAEWASFVPSENVVVPEGVTVYYAKAGTYNGSSVVAVPVAEGETIAKNTGFFVNGAEGNHEFVVSAETPMAISDNMLSCGANSKITNGSLVFGRNNINDVLTVGFFPLASYDIQLPEGIVYIDAAKLNGNPGAKAISVVFDEATDIRSANEATGYRLQAIGIYNLGGQKVNSNYNGIVIINGRKVWKR